MEMKISTATFIRVLAVCALVAAAGCQKQGPAEKAGQQIDKTVAKAGDKINDAADKLKK
jgi:hypothetical protein